MRCVFLVGTLFAFLGLTRPSFGDCVTGGTADDWECQDPCVPMIQADCTGKAPHEPCGNDDEGNCEAPLPSCASRYNVDAGDVSDGGGAVLYCLKKLNCHENESGCSIVTDEGPGHRVTLPLGLVVVGTALLTLERRRRKRRIVSGGSS